MLRKVLSLELSSGVFSTSAEPEEAVTPGVDALEVCSEGGADTAGDGPEEDEGMLRSDQGGEMEEEQGRETDEVV